MKSKKIFMLLMTTATFTLAACGGSTGTIQATASASSAESEAESDVDAESDTEEADIAEEADAETESGTGGTLQKLSDSDVDAEEDASDDDASDDNDDADNFIPGILSSTDYTNNTFGLNFTLPDGWALADSDQLLEINGAVSEVTSDDIRELLEEGSVWVELYAASEDSMQNCNFTVQDVSGYGTVTEDDIESIMESTLGSANTTFENAGYSDITNEMSTTTFNGETVACIKNHATMQGIDMYQTQVMILADTYLGTITTTSFGEDHSQTILDNFTRSLSI